MITLEALRAILDYSPDTGVLRWKCTRSHTRIKPGDVAGCSDALGYIIVTINKRPYKGHRLAWMLHYGCWPDGMLDHADGIPSNNRIANLRECSRAENKHNQKIHHNNRSGVKGVSWYRQSRKWEATINYNGERFYLGRFTHKEEAQAAVRAKREELHNKFCNHG